MEVSDLYGMKFKAVLDAADFPARRDIAVFDPAAEQMHAIACGSIAPDIRAEIEKIRRADLLIFQFPIWWTSMPAILKGWIRPRLRSGVCREPRHRRGIWPGTPPGQEGPGRRDDGLSAGVYAPGGPHGDLHEHLRSLTHTTLEFCGLEVLPTHVVYSAAGISPIDADREVELYVDRLLSLEA